MRLLVIVPVGDADEGLLQALADDLGPRLGLECAVGAGLPLREEWWDGERRRFLSGPIVDALLECADQSGRDPRECWWLGVAEAGLCAPEYDVVFGEATMDGPCAVVGLASLRVPCADGTSALWPRLVTSSVHELGHLAGAEHCANPRCVMYPSRDIADTDGKGNSFCGACFQWDAEHGA
ncbi:MAG TPA: hypothetical protein VGB92_26195 [Longimicrobium sp.]